MDTVTYQSCPTYLRDDILTSNENGPDLTDDVPSDEARAGLPGGLLYRVGGTIRWYLAAIIVYTVVAISIGVYVLTCPVVSSGNRVLRIWNAEVNQFYSGLALSFLLTPAAVLIRRISHDFALLHPFALASARPVSLSDLDIMMDPGFSATLRLFKYSPWTGIIQALLTIAGFALVPLGTLMVYTGTYVNPISGTAVVGMPTEWSNMMELSIEMGDLGGNSSETQDNLFLSISLDVFLGNIIAQIGVIPQTSFLLGPSPTSNLTYEDSARYSGIVTYTWDAQCSYTDDIQYSEVTGDSEWLFNITFPNGEYHSNLDAWESQLVLSKKPEDNETYFVIIGTDQETVNLAEAENEGAISRSNGAWISRVACLPTFSWQTSACTWNQSAGAMQNCEEEPGSNTTELDTAGLDMLDECITLVPLGVYQAGNYIYGLEALQTALMFDPTATTDHQYRAPVLSDFTSMYGMAAQALAIVSTSGYFGTAFVPVEESSPRPAYIVREYVLAFVLLLLAVPSFLCSWAIVSDRWRGIPFRPATFLTVAAGTRGSWWNSKLFGDCVMPHERLLDKHRESAVTFGEDGKGVHVGFTPNAGPIMSNAFYAGLKLN